MKTETIINKLKELIEKSTTGTIKLKRNTAMENTAFMLACGIEKGLSIERVVPDSWDMLAEYVVYTEKGIY